MCRVEPSTPGQAGSIPGAVTDRHRPFGRRLQPRPSIFDGEALPDFIDPFVQRIEPGVEPSLVKVKNISERQKSENPVVAFHVSQYLLDRVTDGNNNAQQNIHRLPHSEKMTL
jgi:hypothetical protein